MLKKSNKKAKVEKIDVNQAFDIKEIKDENQF